MNNIQKRSHRFLGFHACSSGLRSIGRYSVAQTRGRFCLAFICLAVNLVTASIFQLVAPTVLAAAGRQDARPASQPRSSDKEKSVEALAESARQSVVVISHFGRDGKEDGIGAGF